MLTVYLQLLRQLELVTYRFLLHLWNNIFKNLKEACELKTSTRISLSQLQSLKKFVNMNDRPRIFTNWPFVPWAPVIRFQYQKQSEKHMPHYSKASPIQCLRIMTIYVSCHFKIIPTKYIKQYQAHSNYNNSRISLFTIETILYYYLNRNILEQTYDLSVNHTFKF